MRLMPYQNIHLSISVWVDCGVWGGDELEPRVYANLRFALIVMFSAICHRNVGNSARDQVRDRLAQR